MCKIRVYTLCKFIKNILYIKFACGIFKSRQEKKSETLYGKKGKQKEKTKQKQKNE